MLERDQNRANPSYTKTAEAPDRGQQGVGRTALGAGWFAQSIIFRSEIQPILATDQTASQMPMEGAPELHEHKGLVPGELLP